MDIKEIQEIAKKRLAEKNDAYHKGVEYYKEQVELHRKDHKYGQQYSGILYENIKAYLQRLRDTDKPITMAGLIRASGIGRTRFNEIAAGGADYDLYAFMDNYDCTDVFEYDGMPCCKVDGRLIILLPMSEIIEQVILMKEEETETRLYETGRVGDIFALKAKHGWVEEEKAPHTLNQTLVIASETDARKALEMLK